MDVRSGHGPYSKNSPIAWAYDIGVFRQGAFLFVCLCIRAMRLVCTVHCHKECSKLISVTYGVSDTNTKRLHRCYKNLSQNSSTSAQDFRNRFLIERPDPNSPECGLANVSSSAQSLMSVHRTNQTHGPIPEGRSLVPAYTKIRISVYGVSYLATPQAVPAKRRTNRGRHPLLTGVQPLHAESVA